MKITVRPEIVCGKRCAYPVCDKAKLFLKLIGGGRKNPLRTLKVVHLDIIRELGYEVVAETPTI